MASTKRTGKRKKRAALTREEEAFCQHYALHHVGSDAVRHAYRAWKSKDNQATAVKASKLLSVGKIKERIAILEKKVSQVVEQKFEITAERVLQEIAAIAFANADDYYEWGLQDVPVMRRGKIVTDENGNPVTEKKPYAIVKPSSGLSRLQKAAIAGASMTISKTGEPLVDVKMSDKRAALRDLGQHLGLFKMGLDANVSGKGGGPIAIVVQTAEANL